MDPVDYVYGVLGMLNIKIPRMTEPKAVWQIFLSELDKHMETAGIKNQLIYMGRYGYIKIIGVDRSDEIDLHEVESMGHVYRGILRTKHIYSDEE
ncbi:hypothetical protein K492DRAFT_173718 [Lichtheimia hyalospora FSU 10163]|nr:hypothetical protein K492DRAFT_173718 [Lichtheimia hyalospora FSU 10163]